MIFCKSADTATKGSKLMSELNEDFHPCGLIGKSPALNKVLETIKLVKDVNSTVLILGESGTGKELVAKAIHKNSNRMANRFEAINCGAIPENLLESELFGYKKGAFTDAKSDRKGIFETCNHGTLLLDEIGDMPYSLQTKLLRVLQEKQITPVGSSKAIDIDTRLVAATHQDIHEAVKGKKFREDLFFRLSVVVIQVPPLRERKEDIPMLIEYFLQQYAERFSKYMNMPPQSVLNTIINYQWPGNIRELQNSIERGVLLSQNHELKIEDMFQHLDNHRGYETHEESIFHQAFNLPLTAAKQFFEKQYVENLLRQHRGNISEVARKSGRYRADIYRLMERYGFCQDHYRS